MKLLIQSPPKFHQRHTLMKEASILSHYKKKTQIPIPLTIFKIRNLREVKNDQNK